MNPVGEAGNMFSSLFDRVPAKRAGNEEDIAGSVIYLISRAGVSPPISSGRFCTIVKEPLLINPSHTSTACLSVSMAGGFLLPMDRNEHA
jgi:hypothetical protein